MIFMPDGQGRSQSATGIARGGLNPEIAKRPLAQDPTVGDAVEGNASRQAQIVAPNSRCTVLESAG